MEFSAVTACALFFLIGAFLGTGVGAAAAGIFFPRRGRH